MVWAAARGPFVTASPTAIFFDGSQPWMAVYPFSSGFLERPRVLDDHAEPVVRVLLFAEVTDYLSPGHPFTAPGITPPEQILPRSSG